MNPFLREKKRHLYILFVNLLNWNKWKEIGINFFSVHRLCKMLAGSSLILNLKLNFFIVFIFAA